MKTTLTIDDDVAVLLERQSRAEKKPFGRVVNEALRRGTSELAVVDARAVADQRKLDTESESIISGTNDYDRRHLPHGLSRFKVKAHKGKWMAGDDPARLKEILEQSDTQHHLGKVIGA